MFAIGAVVFAALIAGIFSTTSMSAYASSDGDESETNTEQGLKQKNVGSGESTNFNCGENSIDGGFIDAQLCGTVGEDGGDGDGDGGVRVDICHVSASGNEIDQSLPPSAAASHLAQHDGPPGSGPDYLGECDGRTPPR
jgi:hypothetical protein